MLWIKAFHVFFVVAWFAGLFYLPRMLAYHVNTQDDVGHERFCMMERRLYVMTTIGMVGTWVFGIWMVALAPGYLQMGWLHAKLALVIGLSAYHGWLKTRMHAIAQRRDTHSARFYRAINEVPTVALLVILIMVIVKPL